MKTWVRKTLSVGVLAAGALLFAPAAAQADSKQVTGANNGILNGTQIAVPVRVPINVVGNSLGILGVADAQGVGINRTTESGRRGDAQVTGVNNGIANGTQAYLPVSVPVNVAGNSAAVLGHASASGVAVNGRKAESKRTTEHGWGDAQVTGANNGIANGTQIYAPIDVPINVCGNSLAILGGAHSQAICSNDVRGSRHFHHGGKWGKKESVQGHRGGRGAVQATGVNNGILNGTQLYAPISLPINLSGNSAAVLGAAHSRAISRNESARGNDFVQATGANNGILNGTQVAVPISVPINVCGNSLGILGAAHSAAACLNDDDHFGGHGWDRDRGCDRPGHGWDRDRGCGRPGHGHGHGPGKDDDDFGGDNGDVDDDAYKGDGGEKPATNDGYGDVQDDTNDEEPAADGYTKPAAAGSDSSSKGGRGGEPTEASPISGLTESLGGVGSLGLLNTLR